MAKQLLKNISPIYNNSDPDNDHTKMMSFFIAKGCTVDQDDKYETVFQLGKGIKEDDIKKDLKSSTDVSALLKYFSIGFANNKVYMRTKRV